MGEGEEELKETEEFVPVGEDTKKPYISFLILIKIYIYLGIVM